MVATMTARPTNAAQPRILYKNQMERAICRGAYQMTKRKSRAVEQRGLNQHFVRGRQKDTMTPTFNDVFQVRADQVRNLADEILVLLRVVIFLGRCCASRLGGRNGWRFALG